MNRVTKVLTDDQSAAIIPELRELEAIVADYNDQSERLKRIIVAIFGPSAQFCTDTLTVTVEEQE